MKSIEGMRSDRGHGLSMWRARGDDDAATNLKHQQILQPPTRRRSVRQICEPQRFVARPSRQGLSVADGDAIILAGKILENNRCACPSQPVPSVSQLPPTNDKSDSHLDIMTEKTARVQRKRMPSESTKQNGDCTEDDDDDEVELVSFTPGTEKQSISLFTRSCTEPQPQNVKTTRKTRSSTKRSKKQHVALPSASTENARLRRSRDSAIIVDDFETKSHDIVPHISLTSAASATYNKGNINNFFNNGIRSHFHDSMLELQVLSEPTYQATERKYTCRAISCPKVIQAGKQGFCSVHYNQFLICTGKCSWWECECGGRNIDSVNRCKECNSARKGKSPTMSSPMVVTKKASSLHKTVNEKSRLKREELRETIDTNNSIAACGEIVDEKNLPKTQKSIVTSNTKTDNGIRSLRTSVPPDFVAQISTQRDKNRDGRAYCKVITCQKLDQSKLDGFCRLHFNMFALNEAEDVNAGISLDNNRVCHCGELMDGEQKQCANCTLVRLFQP